MMGWRANVIGADGPEHRRLRKPLDDGIARIDQRRVRREVEALCTDLIASFSERGSADLVNEYATIVPMLSLASLFGLDSEEGRELLDALIALFGSAGTPRPETATSSRSSSIRCASGGAIRPTT